ncbi:uncharacterized protein LOC126681506 [Mercurialis annua]|uniref:uncharacterized protein LOC126681506 n=1 Tax=Mercurialis annua TaxID=3986 RepID=UPI00216104E1|nr:uncharacterized protein LOC126681506 [Mercurialis annua]
MLSFWGITKPLLASWSWRNLVKLRDRVSDCYCYKLGEGNISFWYDPWLDGRAIKDIFPEINPIDSDVPRNAKVNDFFRRGQWCLPLPMDDSTEEAWDCITSNYKIVEEQKDCISREAVCFLVEKFVEGCNVETVEHIFFDCPVSKSILRDVLKACCINRDVCSWRGECSWFSMKAVGRGCLAKVIRTAFISTIYNIWRGKNCIVFDNTVVDAVMIKSWIRFDVMLKMYGYRNSSDSFMCIYQNWYRFCN